jgi:hypothetical protein
MQPPTYPRLSGRLVDEISGRLFFQRIVSSLSNQDIATITKLLIPDDRFLHALASATSIASAENLFHSYFRLIWRSPILRFHTWENRLVTDPKNEHGYLIKSRHRFDVAEQLNSFRIAITDDAYVAAKLLNSPTFLHNVIVIAKYDKGAIECRLGELVTLRTERMEAGRRVIQDVTPKVISIKDVFAPHFMAEHLSDVNYESMVTFVEFKMTMDTRGLIMDFWFSFPLSLHEPFFYAQAVNLCFVGSILIDYREISHRLEKVWATSFIGNSSCELIHDRHERTVTARVDGMIMPGHGVLLTWLNKK